MADKGLRHIGDLRIDRLRCAAPALLQIELFASVRHDSGRHRLWWMAFGVCGLGFTVQWKWPTARKLFNGDGNA